MFKSLFPLKVQKRKRKNSVLSECKSYFILKMSKCHNRNLGFGSYYQMLVQKYYYYTRRSSTTQLAVMINCWNLHYSNFYGIIRRSTNYYFR